MGCCSSRPTTTADDASPNIAPTTAPSRRSPQQQHHPITSETAINPTTSATSRRRSSHIASLRRPSSHDTDSPRSASRLSLSEHYNLPLQTPKPWSSKSRKWSPSSLRRERYEFFETRVTGRREIWDALRQVAECVRENDLVTAQGILDAIGVTLPTGRLEEGGYDEQGNLYRVPNAILGDPVNLVSDEEEGEGEADTVIGGEGKEVAVGAKVIEDEDEDKDVVSADELKDDKGKAPLEKDAVKIKCRLSDRGGPDVLIALGKTQTVASLLRLLREEAEIPNQARLRVAYLGRMLDEKKTLQDQGWKDGQVVNVLVAGVFD